MTTNRSVKYYSSDLPILKLPFFTTMQISLSSSLGFKKGTIRKFLFFIIWWLKKTIITIVRSHLSHIFALTLAILSTAREIFEHFHLPETLDSNFKQLAQSYGLNVELNFIQVFWQAFIIILGLLTIAAAVWEFFGNKLATSEQEVLFISGIKELLQKFESFQQKLDKTASDLEAGSELVAFNKALLETSSATLCGDHDVFAALMVYEEKSNTLVLDKENYFYCSEKKQTRLSRFFNKIFHRSTALNKSEVKFLELPLVEEENYDPNIDEDGSLSRLGPAAIAFLEQTDIIHMPKKSNKIIFIYTENKNELYKFKTYRSGWFSSEDNDFEVFRSVLSIPVLNSHKNDSEKPYGVLNFTTKHRDLFTYRDYTMSRCFANLIAQAFYQTNKRKEILRNNDKAGTI